MSGGPPFARTSGNTSTNVRSARDSTTSVWGPVALNVDLKERHQNTQCTNNRDPNWDKHPWDQLNNRPQSESDPPSPQHPKRLLLKIWCQAPRHTPSGIVESCSKKATRGSTRGTYTILTIWLQSYRIQVYHRYSCHLVFIRIISTPVKISGNYPICSCNILNKFMPSFTGYYKSYDWTHIKNI